MSPSASSSPAKAASSSRPSRASSPGSAAAVACADAVCGALRSAAVAVASGAATPRATAAAVSAAISRSLLYRGPVPSAGRSSDMDDVVTSSPVCCAVVRALVGCAGARHPRSAGRAAGCRCGTKIMQEWCRSDKLLEEHLSGQVTGAAVITVEACCVRCASATQPLHHPARRPRRSRCGAGRHARHRLPRLRDRLRPRWHADVIDLAGAYLEPARHTLLVAVDERDGAVVGTGALDARGPAHPPNPRHVAESYPSGVTAQLRRVYVRPEHRRRGSPGGSSTNCSRSPPPTAGTARSICTPIPPSPVPSPSGGRSPRSCTTSGRTRAAGRGSCTSRCPWGEEFGIGTHTGHRPCAAGRRPGLPQGIAPRRQDGNGFHIVFVRRPAVRPRPRQGPCAPPPPPPPRRPRARPPHIRLLRLRRRQRRRGRRGGRPAARRPRLPARREPLPVRRRRHHPQPARRHRGTDQARRQRLRRPGPRRVLAPGRRPCLGVHTARGRLPGRHRRHARRRRRLPRPRRRGRARARRPGRRPAHGEGRRRPGRADHHRHPRPDPAPAAVQPQPRRPLRQGLQGRRPRRPRRHRDRPVRADRRQRLHLRRPRPVRRLLGRPRPGLRHRRPLHRRRHRPHQRPAHGRGRHRRGRARRPGRHPRQGHPARHRHHPHHQPAAQRPDRALRRPGVRAAARAAVDTSALSEDVYEGYADPAPASTGPP